MVQLSPFTEVSPYAGITTNNPVAKIVKIIVGSPCYVLFAPDDLQKVKVGYIARISYVDMKQGRMIFEEQIFELDVPRGIDGAYALKKNNAPFNVGGFPADKEISGGYAQLLGFRSESELRPYGATVENISSASIVKVSAVDFPYFTVGTRVYFKNTGNATLDAGGQYSVVTVNAVGKTFKIDCDLSHIPASITTGTVYAIPNAVFSPFGMVEDV